MRRFSIVGLALCALCLLFFLFFLKRPHFPERFTHKPSTERTTKNGARPITCHSDVIFRITSSEELDVINCVKTYDQLLKSRWKINGRAMELERVDGHSYLNENSSVVEVGGYTGQDAAKLIKKYNPFYTALEPMPKFQKILEKRYKDNRKFKLLKFGLGRKDTTLTINVNSDATSLFKTGRKSNNSREETAQIREITKFFYEIDVKNKPIDLLSINCEGCEYELLELLIANQIVDYVKNIQFQFHVGLPGIANEKCRYCQIMTLLSRSHTPTFQYAYTWQSWRLRLQH